MYMYYYANSHLNILKILFHALKTKTNQESRSNKNLLIIITHCFIRHQLQGEYNYNEEIQPWKRK